MKAAFYDAIRQIRVGQAEPVDPAEGQVQLKVSHCGICGTDMHIYHGHMDQRVQRPLVPGHEASAVVENLGSAVHGFNVGDHVTVMPLDPDGSTPACRLGFSHICEKLNFIGIDSPGAFQQLWTVPAFTLHRLPENLSMKHAALVEPIAVACHDVRLAEVTRGEFVVVIGGGPIGMLVALVARHQGARVVLSEINPYRLELARQIGLNAINPTDQDLKQYAFDQTDGAGADVVFEVSGSTAGAQVMTELPRVRGRIVVVAIFSEPLKVDLFKFFWRELKLLGVRVYEHEDFEQAIQLASQRALPLDELITATYPIDRTGEAFKRMDQGGDAMKVLVECGA